MKQGERINYIRRHRGMTMKQLGMAVGFDDNTAAIRIAQYEGGARNPKPEIAHAMAQALNIHPNRLLPMPDDPVDAVIEHLLWLEDGETSRFYRESARLAGFLSQYWQQKAKVLSGEISHEDFIEWKLQWEKETTMSKE